MQSVFKFCRDCIESAASRGGYWAATVLLAAAGAFIIVATRAFDDNTARWLGFTVGIGATGIAAMQLAFAVLRQRGEMLIAPAIAIAIGAWNTVATSGVFSDHAGKWLAFADAAGWVALAFVALLLHEIRTERVVHSLELREHGQPGEPGRAERVPEYEPAGRAA